MICLYVIKVGIFTKIRLIKYLDYGTIVTKICLYNVMG